MATKGSSSKYTLIKKASSNMFVAVVIASVLVSFSIVSMKFLLDLRSFNAEVQGSQKEVISTLEQNIENFAQLSESYNNFQSGPKLLSDKEQGNRDNTTIVFDALPSKYDYPAVVTALENLSKISGVQLNGLSGSDNAEDAVVSEPNPSPREIPIDVSIEGNYQSIQRFISRLEQTIRPYKIDRISLSGSDDNLRASFTLRTYYQPQIDVSEKVTETITR